MEWYRFTNLMAKVNVLSRFGMVVMVLDNKMIVYGGRGDEIHFHSIGEFEDFIIEKYDKLIVEVEGK